MNVEDIIEQIMKSVKLVLNAHRGVDDKMAKAVKLVDASVKDLWKTKDEIEASLRTT